MLDNSVDDTESLRLTPVEDEPLRLTPIEQPSITQRLFSPEVNAVDAAKVEQRGQLLDAQQQAADQKDPSFQADTQQLAQAIRQAHEELAQALQDPAIPDNQVSQALEKVIGLQTQLEQRTVEYVLSIRDQLTPAQQQRLMGLSQNPSYGRWQN